MSGWLSPFNLTEQPSEATLTLIANNISSSHPYIRSITLNVLPPVFFRSIASPVDANGLLDRGGRVVSGFLEGWTRRVGDPVISKWIVIILCVSMGLNAWLLSEARRGIIQSVQPTAAKAHTSDSTVPPIKPSQPSISVTRTHQSTSSKSSFALDDSESDDEEKHLAAVKKNTRRVRTASECLEIIKDGRPQDLLDEEVIALTMQKKIPLYALEKTLNNLERAVKIRRAAVCNFPPWTELC